MRLNNIKLLQRFL